MSTCKNDSRETTFRRGNCKEDFDINTKFERLEEHTIGKETL